MSSGAEPQRYLYKVMVNQLPREFRYVHAATIDQAERDGIVVMLIGPADQP